MASGTYAQYKLSNETIKKIFHDNIDRLGIDVHRATREQSIKLYDAVVNEMDMALSRAAYHMDSLELPDDDFGDTILNVDFTYNNMYYISINKWGFAPDDDSLDTKEFGIVSKSTMKCLQYAFDEMITYVHKTRESSRYKRMNYHNVVIRLRAFRHLAEFKALKLVYIDLANKAFNNCISSYIVTVVLNYSKRADSKSCDFINRATAVDIEKADLIVFNGMCNTMQGEFMDEYDKITMIHEMCHAYAEYKYGTSRDEPPYTGKELYGLSEETYGDQIYCHGKKFGEAVQLASEKTGYPFKDIFRYGLDAERRFYNPYDNKPADGMNIHTLDEYYQDWIWDYKILDNLSNGRKSSFDEELKTIDNVLALYFYNNQDTLMRKHGYKFISHYTGIISPDGYRSTYGTWANDNKELKNSIFSNSVQVNVRGANDMLNETFLIAAGTSLSGVNLSLYRVYDTGAMGYKIKTFRVSGTPFSRAHKTSISNLAPEIVNEIIRSLMEA